MALYREFTGRSAPPAAPFNEGWLICGRRAGKSAILAICAAYLGCFRDYRPYLAPGEVATIHGFAGQSWLTFRQALGNGGDVRKGEHGTTVVYADRFTPNDEGAI